MIIGISGKKHAGKDTVGRMLQHIIAHEIHDGVSLNIELSVFLENDSARWKRKRANYSRTLLKGFADKIKKHVSEITGVPVTKFYDPDFKAKKLPDKWRRPGMETWRHFLQSYGEGMREKVHDNIWILALWADYKKDGKNWIITDVRYPNEALSIKDRGGQLWRIERLWGDSEDTHSSEVSLDNYHDWDIQIYNNSDLDTLYKRVKKAAKLTEII